MTSQTQPDSNFNDAQTMQDPETDPLAPEEISEQIDLSEGGHAENQALQAELAETKDKMIRAVAEMENIRKRSVKERDDARKYAISGFAKDLVNVADNLRRALDAVPEEQREQISALIGGIEATERELLRSFEKNGITKIEPAETLFDPNIHEVMFEAPGTGKPVGTIIQVVENGYMLHDRLLRPARVGVAKDEGNDGNDHPGGHVDTEA
ncbi:MAG: nucleotide exchange factor GrpE [Bdellovibrionales bacterium]